MSNYSPWLPVVTLDNSLRDKCEQILLLECTQRRKAEELLWKKVFYEVIQKCRQHKTVSQTSAQSVNNTCLAYHWSVHGWSMLVRMTLDLLLILYSLLAILPLVCKAFHELQTIILMPLMCSSFDANTLFI